jgi:hypothetical protein
MFPQKSWTFEGAGQSWKCNPSTQKPKRIAFTDADTNPKIKALLRQPGDGAVGFRTQNHQAMAAHIAGARSQTNDSVVSNNDSPEFVAAKLALA